MWLEANRLATFSRFTTLVKCFVFNNDTNFTVVTFDMSSHVHYIILKGSRCTLQQQQE